MLLKLLLRILKDPDVNIYLIIIDYLIEENRIIKNKYEATGKRLLFNDEERLSLAEHGKPLIKAGFKDYINIVKPDTLMKWYRRLVAKKYDSSKINKTHVGRPEIKPYICKIILKMARENRTWGSERIHGQLKNLDIYVGTESIRRLLRRHHIFPKPDRTSQGTWKEFINIFIFLKLLSSPD